MATLDMMIVYVDDLAKSKEFYRKVLECDPVYEDETFAIFANETGVKISIWIKSAVEPAPAPMAGAGTEINFKFDDMAALEQAKTGWMGAGAKLLQDISTMDFGTTFTIADPDGHRLRAFVPARR